MGLNIDEECTFQPNIYKSTLSRSRSANKSYENIRMSQERKNLSSSFDNLLPPVWDRMNQSIENYKVTKQMRENPEKFNIIKYIDEKTG